MDFSGLTNYADSYSYSAGAAKAALAAGQVSAAQGGDDAELKKACLEFEAYFLNAMFKEMRKTTNGLSGEKKSFAAETFQEMSDDKLTRKMAESGGIGLASFMYRQMARDGAAVAASELYATSENTIGALETTEFSPDSGRKLSSFK